MPNSRTWTQKFSDAFRGMREGVRGQSSFVVHFLIAAAVLAAAAVLRVSFLEWAVLILCIALVLAAEMFNSALERMARAITGEQSPHLRDALDIASAAVLTAVLGTVAVGIIIFAWRISTLLMANQ